MKRHKGEEVGKMRWISDASRRFWQAYCQGLEMSCPVQRLDQWQACARGGRQDAARDIARAIGATKRTVH